ncbi:hypothetical protein N431DRAFT_560535 [Stipitochalara longipes BDJ]|nr:hypothetical protein N431DRAFT_560535 [Stipitochalara longipes BDJ]
MSLDQILPTLQKEVAPFLSRIADEAVGVKTSNNVAKDYALQVCGPVAGSIQYIFNLSLHYHTGEIDTCWRVSRGTEAFQVSPSERSPLPRATQKVIEPPPGDPKLFRQDNQRLAVQVPNTHQLHLHRPGKGLMPVLATFDPNTEGNWIASRIVKRLDFEHQQAKIHKEVPAFMGQSFEKTRIFVDLTCGNSRHRCQHRFYVVNHCKVFDILLGTKLCS